MSTKVRTTTSSAPAGESRGSAETRSHVRGARRPRPEADDLALDALPREGEAGHGRACGLDLLT